jgi:hypothetical protein
MTIIAPTKTDIKSGGGNHKHPGNQIYNQLVTSKRKSFILAHRDEHTKHTIVQYIYETIRKQSPPGRFLQKQTDGSYSIKSKEEAVKKIIKALNENRARIVEYFKLRNQWPPKNNNSNKLVVQVKPIISSCHFQQEAKRTCKRNRNRPVSAAVSPTSQNTSTSTIHQQPPQPSSCKGAATYSDWLKLCDELCKLDPDEMKQIKKQRSRAIMLKKTGDKKDKKSDNNKKKSAKKEARDVMEILCDTMKKCNVAGEAKRKTLKKRSSTTI